MTGKETVKLIKNLVDLVDGDIFINIVHKYGKVNETKYQVIIPSLPVSESFPVFIEFILYLEFLIDMITQENHTKEVLKEADNIKTSTI